MASLLGDLRSRLEGDKRAELPPRADVSIGAPAHNNPMGRLPPELRGEIILLAFGHRTLHLDLALKHPPINYPGTAAPSHANVHRLRHRNVLKPRRWEWWGCECHNAPRRTWELPASEGYWRHQPANDTCREGGAGLCCSVFGEVPSSCGVGVLGWLLSCRAAYLETIDVLHRTNTFHIARTDVYLYLPKLFMPQRLAAITEVELLWDLVHHSWDTRPNSKRPRTDKKTRVSLLTSLPVTFPGLRRLYLSFQGKLSHRNIRESRRPRRPIVRLLHRVTEGLLEWVDGGVARCRHLEECRVALPTTAYAPWKFMATRDTGTLGDGGDGVAAVWRAIPAGPRWIQGAVAGEGVEGYWVCHGRMDWDIEKTQYAPYWYHDRPRGEEAAA